jgi:hypothetical protein
MSRSGTVAVSTWGRFSLKGGGGRLHMQQSRSQFITPTLDQLFTTVYALPQYFAQGYQA